MYFLQGVVEEELLGIFGWVRSKDVTGLAVLPGVNGEVLRAGYGWEGYTEATWRGWVKDVLGLQLFLVFMVKYHVQGVVR